MRGGARGEGRREGEEWRRGGKGRKGWRGRNGEGRRVKGWVKGREEDVEGERWV